MWRELIWSDDSEGHIARHHVVPAEVEEVVNTRPLWERLGVAGSLLIYGRTSAGRPLLVVLALAADDRWYVVTARDLTVSELRVFRAKGR